MVAAAGCSEKSTSGPDAAWPPQMLEGLARTASEEHSLQPCGQTQKWWWNWDRVEKGQIEGYDRWANTAKPQCGGSILPCNARAAYLKVFAFVSPPGIYGHSGMYVRELDIVRIDEASADPPISCPLR